MKIRPEKSALNNVKAYGGKNGKLRQEFLSEKVYR